ncbi:hypothetical protein D3C72_2446920 [compost metagenome]
MDLFQEVIAAAGKHSVMEFGIPMLELGHLHGIACGLVCFADGIQFGCAGIGRGKGSRCRFE